MNDILVIDDIIDTGYQDRIQNLLFSYGFDWHYGPSNVGRQGINDPLTFMDANTVDTFMFTHRFYNNQLPQQPQHSDFIRPLIQAGMDQFGISGEVFRVKSNMLLTNKRCAEGTYHPTHVDGIIDHMVILYYCNDTDGDTIIFNETYGQVFDKLTVKQRISPKKGRAVCFPGKYFHTGCSPVRNYMRAVINCDILIKSKEGM